MKKRILSFAIVATIIGSIAAGCSSTNKASGGDSTSKDTTKMAAPVDSGMKKDSSKQDTTHH